MLIASCITFEYLADEIYLCVGAIEQIAERHISWVEEIMAKQMTREELFNEVWARPMTKIAAELGISDVALKKICDKHRVPVPGRGYWAKVSAGKKVKRAYYRPVEDSELNRVLIYGSPEQRLPVAVKNAKDQAKTRERNLENKVEVPVAPVALIPKVIKTQEKLKKAKGSDMGLVSLSGSEYFDVSCAPGSIERVSSFLNAIVLAAENRGYQVLKGDGALVFFVDEEIMHVKIIEQVVRTKHEPTEAELAEVAKWERRRERQSRSWDSISWTPRPAPPEWDHTPSGLLQVVINEGQYVHAGLRRTFGDGKTQRIENLINSILQAFATWSAAIKEKRADDARRKKEWEEQERVRDEKRRQNNLEGKRIEALSNLTERYQKYRQVMDFITEVEKRSADQAEEQGGAIEEWVSWAKKYAAHIDPLRERLPTLLQYEDFDPWELRHTY